MGEEREGQRKREDSWNLLNFPTDWGNCPRRACIEAWGSLPSEMLASGLEPRSGIKPRSSTLQVDSLPAEPPGKPNYYSIIIHLSINITPRVNHNVNCGLCVIMMCQCKLITYNKFTTLVGNVNTEGGYARPGSGDLCEISAPSSQFFCDHKIVLS